MHPVDDGAPSGDDLEPGAGEAEHAPDGTNVARTAAASPEDASSDGVDPVVGAGITLLGIFLMGTGGARDSHLVFDIGVIVAVLGAMVFVLFVALSALRQRRAPARPDGIKEEAVAAMGPAVDALPLPPKSKDQTT